MTSSIPPLSRKAAKVLSQQRDPLKGEREAPRAEHVSAIRRALLERAIRRRRLRWALPTFAAAAAAAVVVLGWSMMRRAPGDHEAAKPSGSTETPMALSQGMKAERVEGAVFVTVNGASVPLAQGSSAQLGQPIAVGNGSATLALISGTRLDVERDSDLSVTEDGNVQIVRLKTGTLTARVAKVSPGARFVVRTDEADVEVRGTVFRVDRRAGLACGVATSVAVTEGRVAVKAATERELSPGETWTSCGLPETPPAAPSSMKAGEPTARRTPLADLGNSRRPEPSSVVSSAPVSASELAAQNALFGEAMATKARGDTSGAIALFDQFLTRYPASPLHEAAAAHRMRLLASSNDARAMSAARDYASQYPNGFARLDADRILGPAH
jgi:ferric-dicitrate binding protein FerR (iron transport regulator)